MADPKFIHLRVHTAYSLSEGAMKVPALVKKLTENNVPAFAMTDTANMYGGKLIGIHGSNHDQNAGQQCGGELIKCHVMRAHTLRQKLDVPGGVAGNCNDVKYVSDKLQHRHKNDQ